MLFHLGKTDCPLEREIARTKARYPQATYIGIADWAASNWQFLNIHTQEQVLDFYHASADLGGATIQLYRQMLELS